MENRVNDIIQWMESQRDAGAVKSYTRFGITGARVYGISTPRLMAKARELGRDHSLGLRLWQTGIHDARLLATMVADPAQVTPELMDRLVADFDSWDICDQCCMKLFRTHPAARKKVFEWAAREEEFVRRAAFALIAEMTVVHKTEPDGYWLPFLDLIIRYCHDDRNFVRKGVNWALRQIGKQSPGLYAEAKRRATQLAASPLPSARWIGKDALREFNSPALNIRVNGQPRKKAELNLIDE